MNVSLHPHAQVRLVERGATEAEVIATVEDGASSPAKFGRTKFVRNFAFNAEWRNKPYATKQVEAIAVAVNQDNWLVITVIVRFF